MTPRWRLFPKYTAIILALVGGLLVASGAIGIWFSYRETEAHLVALQIEKAESAATRIEQYVLDIEHQLSWTALPRVDSGGDALEQRRIEYLKLLRQAPAITEVVWIDPSGREQLRVSRLAMDAVGAGTDLSQQPKFREAIGGRVYWGPVYFRKDTEPYMTIARPAGSGGGVTAAEVNLKFVWEVVSRIKIGEHGLAYVVDRSGTLIAHPDISLVLKKSDLSALPQVAALGAASGVLAGTGGGTPGSALGRDLRGQEVFSAHAPIPTLQWNVFVESPRDEALAPLYATIARAGLVLAAGLVVSILASFFVARALVRPLRALQEGAERIGAGELDRRIEVRTGDELEGLADRFNAMAGALKASYADLERKVEERTAELSEALERQTATSDVLVAISEAQTDATPVFETIARNAHRLSGAVLCNVLRFDGKLLHIAACHGFSPAQEQEIRRKYPVEAGDASVLSGRVVLNGRTEQIEDTLADPRYDRAHAGIVGWRRMLGVPMIREGVVQGVIVLAWREPGQTPPGLVDLLKTFADQAVIAIENVRLFNETREALDRQTATAEILQVISGSVSDAAPVFEKILESCDHLFDSTEQGVLLLGDDGRLHLGAHHGVARERLEGLFPVHQTAGLVASILDRQVLHFRNALEDPDVPAGIRAVAERIQIGAYSQVFAPMVWEGRAIGTLYVTRQPPTGFAPKEIDLLRTFADQAVIAIQNARLFRETREALDRQTATSEVLRVISRSPTDVQPVFEAVAERSGLLCHAEGSRIFLPDGDSLLAVTGYRSNAGVDGGRGDRLPKKPTSVIGRAFLQGGVVQVEDASLLDPAAYPDTAAMHQRHGFRTVLAVPMMRDGAAVGVIGLSRRDARAFSDREIELVRTFADQAVIAIQNVRLFNETREALEQQTATADILRVISGSPTDTQPVFDAILERATKLCDAGTGLLFRYEEGAYVALATRMADPAAAEVFRHPRRPGPNSQTGLGRIMRERRAVHIPDMMNDPAYDARDPLRMDSLAAGMRSWLGVPMLKEGALVGAIVIYRSEPRPFSEQQLALLQTFADQAVIAIQNARLFNETREALERQTAIADILSVISSSPTDTGPVFEAIVQSCQRLFGGLFVAFARPRGELLHMVAHADDGTPRGRAGAELPPWPLDRGSGAGTCILEARVVNVADTEAAVPQFPRMRDLALRLGYRSGLFVPLLRDERAVGAIVILRAGAGAFNEREVDLARAFADQAVIAIENVRLFNEIEDKSRQLELANKHKSEFLANMSHELRTPLNAIIGFSEVLAERMFGEVNDKQLEYLKDIHASGHHLLSLINDILDLSKIEAGRMELDLSTVNLPMLLDNCTTLVRERASRQGLTLSLEVEEGVGDWVADVRKVKQIVINLLSNAVKFTPAGGRVTLRARRIDEQVEIAVIDTGVGISPDQQALVFEEFRQAGGDYLRKAEGTGLGLSLAKRFVELHGGTIRVDSAPGKGSTFAFVLPRGEAVAPVALQA